MNHHHHHYPLQRPIRHLQQQENAAAFAHSEGGGGTLESWEMARAFRRGRFVDCDWDVYAVRRASQEAPTAARDLTTLELWHNRFADGCLAQFLQIVVAHAPKLQNVTLSVRGRTHWLGELNQVDFPTDQLVDLTLVVDIRQRISDAEAQHLRLLVQVPRDTLTIHYSLLQQDYSACLQALALGQQERIRMGQVPCHVRFRNVRFPNHKTLLPAFARQLVETNVVSSLHLSPRRRLADSDWSAARAGIPFLQSLPILLTSLSLAELEIDALVLSDENVLEDEPVLLESIRQGLQMNTTLQRLSLEASYGLSPLWTHAVFPALGTNRTLQCLDFGRTDEILMDFLQRLPTMRGLRYIRAPWHFRCCRSWIYALEQMDTIQCIEFVFGEHFFNSDLPCSVDIRKEINERCRRNRLIAAARSFLRNAPCPTGIVRQLNEFEIQKEQGFSAFYVVVRGCACFVAALGQLG